MKSTNFWIEYLMTKDLPFFLFYRSDLLKVKLSQNEYMKSSIFRLVFWKIYSFWLNLTFSTWNSAKAAVLAYFFSFFSIMNKWKFGICDWILWIMQRSNSGRKRTRSDPDGSVLLNTRVGWYRISGEKIVIDILKFEILRGG